MLLRQNKAAEVQCRAAEVGTAFACNSTWQAYEGLRRTRRACPGSKKNASTAAPTVLLASGEPAGSYQEGRDRWLDFFAGPESADITSLESLIKDDLERRSARPAMSSVILDLATIPTIGEVEQLFRAAGLRKGRQPGLDGIVDEVYAECSEEVAALLHPLYVKRGLSIDSPISYRGCRMAELYKGRAPWPCAPPRGP